MCIRDRIISSTSTAIIFLLLIGALTGTWLISGIVPAMIYYGLKILNPEIFLFASCIICAIVSLASGSSWSTIATVGIALLGIGNVLGISEGLIAGSIISGAYFGDKLSPLSDTTNLAAAMSGTNLFTHIKYMMYTTIPSFIITLIIFFFLGISLEITSNQNINELKILLANEATTMLHGKKAAQKAEETAKKTFGKGSVGDDLPLSLIHIYAPTRHLYNA